VVVENVDFTAHCISHSHQPRRRLVQY